MKPRRMVSEDSLIDCYMFLVLLCSQGVYVCITQTTAECYLPATWTYIHSNSPPHSDHSICEYKLTYVLLPSLNWSSGQPRIRKSDIKHDTGRTNTTSSRL